MRATISTSDLPSSPLGAVGGTRSSKGHLGTSTPRRPRSRRAVAALQQQVDAWNKLETGTGAMDFAYTAEDEAFRDELRGWLDEHLPKFLADWGGDEDARRR